MTHFKGRAGRDSFSVKHGFCVGEEKCARRNFPRRGPARQDLPGRGKYCRVKSAITSTFHKSAPLKIARKLEIL
jgi:hypothetical protein